MRRISIAGTSFEFATAKLIAYHCASGEADWNIELVREGESRWLSGTIVPGPRTPADAVHDRHAFTLRWPGAPRLDCARRPRP